MTARPLPLRAWWLASAVAACGPGTGETSAGSGSGTTTTTTTTPTDPPASTTGASVTSTSGASTTSGADTSGSSDDGLVFIPKTDACGVGGPEMGWSSHCTVPECDIGLQDCPRDQKCMPWANDGGNAWNVTRCVSLDRDPVPVGGTCTVLGSATTGLDDCDEGAMCWGVDPETLQGTCIDLCDYENFARQGCVEPTECLPLNEGTVPLCATPCNPLQAGACPDGEACRSLEIEGGFYCLPLAGGQVIGSSQYCDEATCEPSQVCASTDVLGTCATDNCCTDLCDLGDPGADALCAAIDPTLACEPFYAPGREPAGLELVGLCALPS